MGELPADLFIQSYSSVGDHLDKGSKIFSDLFFVGGLQLGQSMITGDKMGSCILNFFPERCKRIIPYLVSPFYQLPHNCYGGVGMSVSWPTGPG